MSGGVRLSHDFNAVIGKSRLRGCLKDSLRPIGAKRKIQRRCPDANFYEEDLGRSRHWGWQCSAVRRHYCSRSRRIGPAARIRSARMAWRELGAYPQHPLHARCTPGCPDRRLPRGRVLAGPLQGHWRHHQRDARSPRDPRISDLQNLDASSRRSFSTIPLGHITSVAHQRLFYGWRQSAGQRLLPKRASIGNRGAIRIARRTH